MVVVQARRMNGGRNEVSFLFFFFNDIFVSMDLFIILKPVVIVGASIDIVTRNRHIVFTTFWA